MKLCVFLHFYQPYNQQDDILDRIVNECYIPLTKGLLKTKRAKAVININGALTNLLFEKGYKEVINNLNTLKKEGKIEYTSSAMYHSFLPLMPEDEISRQIKVNNDTNKNYLNGYDPEGFFPPEMGVNEKVIKVVSKMGFNWIGVADLAYPGDRQKISTRLFKEKETGLNILFRNKRISSLMLSGVIHDPADFINETKDLHETDEYWFTVMDAETFGHHRIGHEKFLFEVLDNPFFEPITAEDLLKLPLPVEYFEIRPSTWTNEEQDFWLDRERKKFTTAKSFILWKDPENPIHKLQWEMTNYVINEVESFSDKDSNKYKSARLLLDRALASDHFWWASAKPWWSLEMIEQGAFQLKEVLNTLNKDQDSMKKAEEMYRSIMDRAFEWQRTGYVRKKHLENSGTFMKEPLKNRTSNEWFNQIILEFEDQMKKAAENRDFEKAVKWRDAVLKLRQGSDMYDVLHVVDELWSARSIPGVKPFLEHNWQEFSDFAKDSFEGVNNEEEFEEMKKDRDK